MTPNPMTIDPEVPVETAMATMRERQLRHLPVVDDLGKLLGVVSDSDMRSAMFGPAIVEYLPANARDRLAALARSLSEVRVRHVMTWGAMTIGPDAPVAQAAAVMAEARVGSLARGRRRAADRYRHRARCAQEPGRHPALGQGRRSRLVPPVVVEATPNECTVDCRGTDAPPTARPAP